VRGVGDGASMSERDALGQGGAGSHIVPDGTKEKRKKKKENKQYVRGSARERFSEWQANGET